MADRFFEDLERGADLFNRGLYFEAHEAWEDGWLVERGGRRLLLHGLIQVAAAFVKLERGEPGGTLRLLLKGIAKLEEAAPEDGGIDLRALVQDLGPWQAAAARMVETGAREFNARLLPRLRWRATGSR